MSGSQPAVTKVTYEGNEVFVRFEDGHIAIFEAYENGTRLQVARLYRFTLKLDNRVVVHYDGHTSRTGTSTADHCFIDVVEGYSIERIVSYWDAARNHSYNDMSLPWAIDRILGSGWTDLDRIKEGDIPLPRSYSSI